MKKKKTISIKVPKLRNIRDTLRYVISEVKIGYGRDLIYRESRDDIDEGEIPILSDRIDALDTAWKKSICVCPVCGSRTSDMTYNPVNETWFCVRCYKENQAFYVKQGEGHLYP